LGSASYATTASYALNGGITINTGSFAITGSNTFYGNQIISGSGINTILQVHGANAEPWAFGIYNDTYNLTQSVLAGFVDNTGEANIGTEINKPLYIYTNANYSNPTLIISSSGITVGIGGITGSLFGTASWASNANVFPFSGSAGITGSMYVVGPTNIISIPTYQSTDFFLIRNAVTTFKVNRGVEITSSAQIPLQINNETSQSILQISQSGLITFATFSFDQTGIAPNGGIYFTSSSMYIGLD
jgi:hypothetical protein